MKAGRTSCGIVKCEDVLEGNLEYHKKTRQRGNSHRETFKVLFVQSAEIHGSHLPKANARNNLFQIWKKWTLFTNATTRTAQDKPSKVLHIAGWSPRAAEYQIDQLFKFQAIRSH
ncbi:hypothetical protein KM043_015658 [Ampulex compressa]|nr:hypothetical protein KM043_015658 [Ampulex compressa]